MPSCSSIPVFESKLYGLHDPGHELSPAKVIIELCHSFLKIRPSQRSHFFLYLIFFRLGNFHVKSIPEEDNIDWKWLKSQKPDKKIKYSRKLRFKRPFITKIDNWTYNNLIYKPS
jgi:hypothetical protein